MSDETETTEAPVPVVFGITLAEIDSVLDLLAERQTPLSAKAARMLVTVKAQRQLPPKLVQLLTVGPAEDQPQPQPQQQASTGPAPTVGKRGRGKGRRAKHPAG
jgi:hypothetical protein